MTIVTWLEFNISIYILNCKISILSNLRNNEDFVEIALM